MNKSALLTFALILMGSSFFTSNASDLTDSSILGEVKTIKTTEFTPKLVNKKWTIGDKLSSSIRVFDRSGIMLEESLLNENDQILFVTKVEPLNNGKLVDYISYDLNGNVEYKENGRLSETDDVLSMKTYANNDVLESYTKSMFDAQGNVTKTTSYEMDELTTTKTYGYNDNAQISFIKVDQKDGEDYVQFYNYNAQNLLEEVKVVTLAGEVLNQMLYEYDNAGKLFKMTLYPTLRSSREHQVTVYTPDGKVKESTYYDHSGNIIQKEVFTYADTGFLSKSEAFDLINDVLINSYTIHCDEYGREVNRITFDTKGVPVHNSEIEYTLDKHNNWIVKIEKDAKRVTSISKREIEYF